VGVCVEEHGHMIHEAAIRAARRILHLLSRRKGLACDDKQAGRLLEENTMPDKEERDAPKLRATYEQLCDTYRAIDDLRAKHLGFLPLVTGGGLVLLTGRQEEFAREFFLPLGIFGFAVTAGLFSYEIFGMRRCHDLIYLGRHLEGLLNSPGQFAVPRRFVGSVINEPFAAGIIYPAVMAAWMYLALFYTARLLGMVISIGIFLLGFILIFGYDLYLGCHPKAPPPPNWVVPPH
jgi:hypothetical protein